VNGIVELTAAAYIFSFDESSESVTLLDSDSTSSLSLDADPSDDEDDNADDKTDNLCKITSHWRSPLVKLRNLFQFIQAFSKRKIK
jgi:hypothetical protein